MSNPQNGTVTLDRLVASATTRGARAGSAGPVITATYRPRIGYFGPDSFQFVAIGPGGRSAPGTVSITVVGRAPTAQSKTASTGDNQLVRVDLTANATEGPFTGAALVGTPPASQATVRLVEGGNPGARTYALEVTPAARFNGTLTIAYTLTNAIGTSAPATVTITVTARPDPTADATIRAISDAQAEATRNFARTQVGIFMQHLQSLHGPGSGSGFDNGIRFTSNDPGSGYILRGSSGFLPMSRNDAEVMSIIARVSGPAPDDGGQGLGFGPGGMAGRGGPGMAGFGGRAGVPADRSSDRDPLLPAAGDAAQRSPLGLWTGGAIQVGTQDRRTGRDKISFTTSGLSAGIDLRLSEGAVIGIGGGWGADVSRIGGDVARVRSENSLVAGYASVAPFDGSFVDLMFGYGTIDFRSRRTVDTNPVTVASGSRSGKMLVGATSFGIDRTSDRTAWSLYGRIEWLDATLDAYAETGAGRANLRFEARKVRSLSSTLGAKLAFTQPTSFGLVTPRFAIEWRHEFARTAAQRLDYADVTGPAFFGFDTVGWQRDDLSALLGSRLTLTNRWSLDLELGLRAAKETRSATFRIGITKSF